MNNCTLIDNSVGATLYNNLIYSTAVASGGGAAFCTLNNCTLSGNWAIASPDIDRACPKRAVFCKIIRMGDE